MAYSSSYSDNRSLLQTVASTSTITVVGSSLALVAAYCFALATYRFIFHPLARFPGPKLAGLTYWFEYYYDVHLGGQYLFKIKELHEKYGPILRVNPNEVHIADSEFFSEIYHLHAHKTHRDEWYNTPQLGDSVVSTCDHDLHAARRQALSTYFSMQSVRKLEGRIAAIISTMCSRLETYAKTGQVLNLYIVFSALAVDVVTEYSFGKENSTNTMSNPVFAQSWVDMGKNGIPINPFSRQFKTVTKWMVSMPPWLAVKLTPSLSAMIIWQDGLLLQIKLALKNSAMRTAGNDSKKSGDINVIDELISSPHLAPQDKLPMRLRDEATVLQGAGSVTTADCLARTTFYILSNPEIENRLRVELKAAIPDPLVVPTLNAVSQLGYLNAVIEEGIRLALPVLARSPRVFDSHVLQYKGWTIPPGVAVSESPYFVSTDPRIFPEPFKFDPNRWVKNPGLQKYQVSFSRGRRMCIGINLAYAELRLGLATLFRRFDLELFETTRRDVDIAHDYFVGMTAMDSQGIRVKIRGELK